MKMEFEDALSLIKQGYDVRRRGWNGEGMYVSKTYSVSLGDIKLEQFAFIKTADDYFTPWTPSQKDMFATDWEVVREES